MPDCFDVVIVGGGPAGSTLARLLPSEFRVLLLEHRSEELLPEKCCGGLIAPDAQEMLAHFRLGLPREVLGGPQLFVVRTVDLQTGIERHYQRFYFNADRRRFEAWLLSLLPPQVDVRYETLFRGAEKDGEDMRVFLSFRGKNSSVRTRCLVGADGAGSRVRRIFSGDHPMPELYAAVQIRHRVSSSHPSFTAIFDSRLTDFYGWTIPKDDALLIGAAFPRGRGAREALQTLIRGLRKFDIPTGKPLKLQGAPLFRPVGRRQLWIGERKVLLIGEAGGFISPSSAEGFSFAFKSAEALADAFTIAPENPIGEYRRLTAGLRRSILLKTFKGKILSIRLLRCILMSSGLAAVPVRKLDHRSRAS